MVGGCPARAHGLGGRPPLASTCRQHRTGALGWRGHRHLLAWQAARGRPAASPPPWAVCGAGATGSSSSIRGGSSSTRTGAGRRFPLFVAETSTLATIREFSWLAQLPAAPGAGGEGAARGGQQLLVCPLAEAWIDETAELLTDAFSQAMGYIPAYRKFLGAQIASYLREHVALPPKAVVLVGVLLPAGAEGPAVGERSESEGYVEESSKADGSREVESSKAEVDEAAASQLQPPQQHQGEPKRQQLEEEEGLQHPESTPPAAAAADGGDGSADWQPTPMAEGGSFSSSGFVSSSSSSSENVAESEAAGPAGDGGSENGILPPGAVLAGTLELSFSEATRSRYLTLNPPPGCSYLCNMAVSPEHRQRGIGLEMLRAAEALCCALGERDVYLHLRLVDKPAAALYERGGYSVVKKDLPWVRLVGIDQRYLMRKQLEL